jgi:hypothetical protein
VERRCDEEATDREARSGDAKKKWKEKSEGRGKEGAKEEEYPLALLCLLLAALCLLFIVRVLLEIRIPRGKRCCETPVSCVLLIDAVGCWLSLCCVMLCQCCMPGDLGGQRG